MNRPRFNCHDNEAIFGRRRLRQDGGDMVKLRTEDGDTTVNLTFLEPEVLRTWSFSSGALKMITCKE
jgi:hypothetical protein